MGFVPNYTSPVSTPSPVLPRSGKSFVLSSVRWRYLDLIGAKRARTVCRRVVGVGSVAQSFTSSRSTASTLGARGPRLRSPGPRRSLTGPDVQTACPSFVRQILIAYAVLAAVLTAGKTSSNGRANRLATRTYGVPLPFPGRGSGPCLPRCRASLGVRTFQSSKTKNVGV